jgi:pimeloyl-ACP methyl ester carboxylesterase
MSAAPDPVDQSVLDDLQRRLRATNRVRVPKGTGWARGVDTDYLAELSDYWAGRYDWRIHEQRIHSMPWADVRIGATDYSALQQKSSDTAPTVVLLHGWPDSILRFDRVLPLLTDVNVVVPCLPGFPFAPPLTEQGMSTTKMAEIVDAVMSGLGYQRYVVSGGDIGSGVAEALAMRAPDRVAALHLTDVPYSHLFSLDESELTDDDKAYLAAGREWQMSEGSYGLQQSTKPHTLAVGLADSPAGLLAWIVEKLRSWSDCNGDVESVFSRDDLLTWVTAYWVTGTIGTSFSPYVEPREPVPSVPTPTAVQLFLHDLLPAPRSFAERFFNIAAWLEESGGGHFAAWERPERFVDGVRAAIALAS